MSHVGKPDPQATPQDRRRFFRSLGGLVCALVDEFRGKPQHMLSDLWELPPEGLAVIIPAVRPGFVLLYKNDMILVSKEGENQPVPLYQCDKTTALVCERFDSKRTIGQIADDVTALTGWERGKAFALVRNTFLDLVKSGVCKPFAAPVKRSTGSHNNSTLP